MAIYKAIGPDGKKHEMEGPDGASDADIISAFEQAFPMKDSPSDSPLEGAARTAANYAGEDFAREILPAGAGVIAGLATGGLAAIPAAGIAAAGTRAYQNIAESVLGGRPLGSSADQARMLGNEFIANAGGEGLGRGIGLAARYAKPNLVKGGAQIMRVMTGTPERAGEAVLRDPALLGRAKTVSEAGKDFSIASEGVPSGVEGLKEITGKRYLSNEKRLELLDSALDGIKDNSLTIQKALVARQQAMEAIATMDSRDKALIRDIGKGIDDLDSFIEKQLPDIGGARQGYREAKIAENFNSWFPQNKNLSPNMLRTTAAVAAAGKGLMEGRPWLMAGLPLISPRIWGMGIRATAAAARPIVGLGNVGMRAGIGYELNAGHIPVK